MKMASGIADNQSAISQDQATFLDQFRETAKKAGELSAEQIEEILTAQAAAEKWYNLVNIFQTVLMAVVIAVTFVFIGPAAGVMAAGLYILQSRGVLEDMFKGIDSPTTSAPGQDGIYHRSDCCRRRNLGSHRWRDSKRRSNGGSPKNSRNGLC